MEFGCICGRYKINLFEWNYFAPEIFDVNLEDYPFNDQKLTIYAAGIVIHQLW